MSLSFSFGFTKAQAAALDWSEPRLCFRLRYTTTGCSQISLQRFCLPL